MPDCGVVAPHLQVKQFEAQAAYMAQQQEVANNLYAQLNEARSALRDADTRAQERQRDVVSLRAEVEKWRKQAEQVGLAVCCRPLLQRVPCDSMQRVHVVGAVVRNIRPGTSVDHPA